MYIEKLETQDLANDNPGRAVVLFSAKEISTLDNLMYRLSKERVLTDTEHNLKRDFKILHSLVVLGMLPDSDIIELYKSGDVKDVEHGVQ